MAPFALSVLGIHRQQVVTEDASTAAPEATPTTHPAQDRRGTRASRRATSHYNAFQTSCQPATENPPSYAAALKQRVPSRPSSVCRNERVPPYSCTVATEGKMWLQLESYNPLHGVIDCPWKEVYFVLRGTLLLLHRIKDDGPGKLLRSYTLQHAEVGLATDASHTLLVPQTRLARLIPAGQREKAWQKDPSLYRPVKQSILRLRAETDQMLIAHESEERLFQWIYSLSAAIDISPSIDERSIPRQCTVPRRRRRRLAQETGDIDNPALRAEQERILRDMYPSFAERPLEDRPDLSRTVTEDAAAVEARQNAARDDEEIDLAIMCEDFTVSTRAATSSRENRPVASRQTTDYSETAFPLDSAAPVTAPSNLNPAGKWEPTHPRTSAQVQRYIRRCMPVLLVDAPRASDVLLCQGRRVRINWRMELLEEWELKPPSYRSHKFDREKGLERSKSQSSVSGASANHNKPETPTANSCNASCTGSGEQIEQLEHIDELSGTLNLTKTRSMSRHAPSTHAVSTDVPGIVFCF